MQPTIFAKRKTYFSSFKIAQKWRRGSHLYGRIRRNTIYLKKTNTVKTYKISSLVLFFAVNFRKFLKQAQNDHKSLRFVFFLINFRKLTAKNTRKLENLYKSFRFLKKILFGLHCTFFYISPINSVYYAFIQTNFVEHHIGP